MFCNRRPLELLVFPIIPFAAHPLVHMITGFINILFSTLGACYKVNSIGRLTTSVTPMLDDCLRADFAICVEIIIQTRRVRIPRSSMGYDWRNLWVSF